MKTVSIHKVRAILMLVAGGGLLALAYVVNPHFFSSPRAQAGLMQNVSGWTWSENIGWTSFNSLDCDSDKNVRVDAGICGGDNSSTIARDYGVSVNTSTKATGGTGALSGTAWNEYVGWVSFDRATTGNPPTAPFNGGVGPIAQVDWTTGSTTGWMRVLSAMDTPVFGAPTWKAPALTAGPILTPQLTSSQAIDTNGNYAYLGGDSKLVIMDISNPANPVKVSSFDIEVLPNPPSWDQESTDVRYRVVGGVPLVFVTTYFGGLVIVDVTNPAAPVLRGKVALSNQVWAVDFSTDGNYAFVAGKNGLHVVDIQDTTNPIFKTVIAFTPTVVDGVGNGVVVVGNYAYVAYRNGGLRVVDVSNPLVPVIAGSYTTGFSSDGWAYNVYYKSPNLYVAKHTTSSMQSNSQVLIFDLVNPAVPALVSSATIPLVAPQPDISSTPDRGPRSVLVDGNYMFVASSKAGVYVYDVSDVVNPVMLSLFTTPYSGSAWEVSMRSGKIYLAGGNSDLIVIEPSVGPWWDGWINLGGAGTNSATEYSVATTNYPVGDWPHGVAFDPVTNSMWVVNSSSNSVSKINVNTGTKTDYMVESTPHGVAFDSLTNSIWVTNVDSDSVSKVNVNTGTKTDYPVEDYPYGIAFDPITNSIWVTNVSSDSVSKINVNTGTRTNYPVGDWPYAIAFDPITNSIWVTNVGSDSVSKVNVNTGTKTDYPVEVWPHAIAFDPITNSVWVANSSSNSVSKVNVNTGSTTNYPVGSTPRGVAFDSITNSVWVTNAGSDSVSKVNVNTGTKTDYPVEGWPRGVAFDPVTNSIWVANATSDSISKLKLTPIYESLSYGVKITADKFSGWAWGSNITGWMDFSPKIGGISVGPVVGAPPCTISDVPEGSWGACQRIGSCPLDENSTMGIKVGTCTTGGTVTSACTLSPLVCAGGSVGTPPIPGCNYNGVCNVGETPITCPKDCKIRYFNF